MGFLDFFHYRDPFLSQTNPVHKSNPISLMYISILLSHLGLYLPSGLVHIFLPNIMHISLVLIMFKIKLVPLQARGAQRVPGS